MPLVEPGRCSDAHTLRPEDVPEFTLAASNLSFEKNELFDRETLMSLARDFAETCEGVRILFL